MTETAVALREKARSQGYGKAVVPKPAPPTEAPLDRSSFAPQLPEDGVRPAPILSSLHAFLRSHLSSRHSQQVRSKVQSSGYMRAYTPEHKKPEIKRGPLPLFSALFLALLPATLLTFSPQQEFKHHARASSRPCRGRAQARARPP